MSGLQGPSPVKNVHVTLKRLSKGSYSWDISIHDDNEQVVKRKIQDMDIWLHATYAEGEP